MDLELRFQEIHSFLHQHRSYWKEEVLSRYPNDLEDFPQPWIEELAHYDDEYLYEVERKGAYLTLKNRELRDYFQTIAELEALPKRKLPDEEKLPHRAILGICGKKQYEIQTLLPLIKRLHDSQAFAEVIDFAGGIGYFAQILTAYGQIPTLSLDFDAQLQETGRRRLAKYQDEQAAPLEYQVIDLLNDSQLPLKNNALYLGLHGCGSISVEMLRRARSANDGIVLSFGCCYYRTRAKDLLLSSLSASFPLEITPPALTLASRSHKDEKSPFLLSKRVKLYRYLIHLYCYHILELTEFENLGNSSKKLYMSDFATYGIEQLRRLNIPTPESHASSLASFFRNPQYQQRVRLMIAANILRGHLGRLLEIYLTLDRALFYQDSGREVDVAQYFSPQKSPRNIGILGAMDLPGCLQEDYL